MLRHELETPGFLISRHPLALFQSALPARSWGPAKELPRWTGRRVATIGWYVTGKLVEAKHGEPMEFLEERKKKTA